MTAKPTAVALIALPALAAAFLLAAAPSAARASSCSCAMREMCIDTTSRGPNAVCDTKKCPAGAKFSKEACPTKDLVATCSLKGPDYVTHNRYYTPLWKPDVVKGMCAGMKGEFAPATR